ncbi:MAG: hypothetical protein MJ074_01955 [Oscillospiraceae bacterium]|nr:hypothetical protein [Oscillospiraceae bacterium]
MRTGIPPCGCRELKKKSIADGLKAYTVIDRKGFGTINFAERQIGIGLGYARSDAELLGFWAVPAVIKRGIEISSHAKHKGNMINADTPLKTYTFGAKVNLNGEDGIMGVVVRKTNGLNYKAHKILFPDGTVFD